jgi:prepilin-type N-terminal cleavage/methylation domain-containing protein
MSKKKYSKKRGFSLVEMLVVVAIIGMLATILLINYTGQLKKSRDQKRRTDAESIKLACNMYANQNQKFPVQTVNSTAWGALVTDLDPYISLSSITDPQQAGGGAHIYTYVGAVNNCTITFYSEVSGANQTIHCID